MISQNHEIKIKSHSLAGLVCMGKKY